ncbi:Candidapepsin [Lachnellula occidentalis]|uniref:Candidapepsin n=1 Tax=Lachnellula occidentalis TaxID=215460 RepID=A0A8H8UAI8_9HELO|nr:Candidapepsin [Lachnellula occidentalis]
MGACHLSSGAMHRAAATIEALSATPSTQWYGDDGTWSAISIRVGTPPQWVDVMVNTVSSETWVVGPAGCSDNNSICQQARGGIYNLSTSSTYRDQGLFSLGVDNRLGGQGYADYGFDQLTFGSTGVILDSTIIGSINTTEYFLGEFGLGVVPGNFNNVSSLAAISGLVEQNGAIPSHSYGYTAGATYQQKGVPASLTLGGYDANRLVAHNTTFNLNPSKNPAAYIDYMSVFSTATSNNWTTPVQLISTTDRVTAIIDSSTPYLWLPQSVCDQFAQTLGLTYNSTLDLYGFDGNASQHDVLKNADLEFTITLSDTGSSTGTVNITLPYAAFDLQLTFPAIPNTTYGSSNSEKYYFPIKRASNQAQYTIGRAFLQEAYLITDYERNTYSIHQAVHTSDPLGNTSIINISQSQDSDFTPLPSYNKSNTKLATGAIVGIVIGVIAILALAAFGFYFWRRRTAITSTDDEKPLEIAQPRGGFLGRFRQHPLELPANEPSGSTIYATEVGADVSHERFELPAPFGPAELDSEAGSLSGTTDHESTTDSYNMSAYEQARRKLERQQAAADLAQSRREPYPTEKIDNDSPSGMQFLSPPGSQSNSGTRPVSPATGGSHGSNRSQTTSRQPSPSPTSPVFTSDPTSPTSPMSPPPTYRKISPANGLFAGLLPGTVQLPAVVPRIAGRDGEPDAQEQTLESTLGASTLGSQYTANESTSDIYNDAPSPLPIPSPRSIIASHYNVSTPSASGPASDGGQSISGVSGLSTWSRGVGVEDETKFLREDMLALRAGMQSREVVDPYRRKQTMEVPGEDLVHVPVLAESRFSWEQDRLREEGGTR